MTRALVEVWDDQVDGIYAHGFHVIPQLRRILAHSMRAKDMCSNDMYSTLQ